MTTTDPMRQAMEVTAATKERDAAWATVERTVLAHTDAPHVARFIASMHRARRTPDLYALVGFNGRLMGTVRAWPVRSGIVVTTDGWVAATTALKSGARRTGKRVMKSALLADVTNGEVSLRGTTPLHGDHLARMLGIELHHLGVALADAPAEAKPPTTLEYTPAISVERLRAVRRRTAKKVALLALASLVFLWWLAAQPGTAGPAGFWWATAVAVLLVGAPWWAKSRPRRTLRGEVVLYLKDETIRCTSCGRKHDAYGAWRLCVRCGRKLPGR